MSGEGVAEIAGGAVLERVFDVPELLGGVILAVDTALGTSVAVGCEGRVFEVSRDDVRGHAESIGGLIVRACEGAGVEPSGVSGVVCGMGPGPFTGLRVGIAAARSFALARGVSVMSLQGHDAVALAVFEAGATSGVRVVQDAKRRELFVTEYESLDESGLPVRVGGPRVVARAEYVPVVSQVWPGRVPAGRLVQLAARYLVAGREFEVDRALYLRAPDVGRFTKRDKC